MSDEEGLWKKKEECPHCGAIVIIHFTQEEVDDDNTKNVVCHNCNGVTIFPAGVGKPHFLPHATDQEGRPRLRTA